MYQPGGDANPDQYAPLSEVELGRRGMRASTVPVGSSYYNMLDYMCVPCYDKKGVNQCLYTGGTATKYDPRDVPQTAGSPYAPCAPAQGVLTSCYFPEAGERMTDACSNVMFGSGLASSMARQKGDKSAATPKSLQALASLAARRKQECPNYLCKNDDSYQGSQERKSFSSASCACVSEPVAKKLKKSKK